MAKQRRHFQILEDSHIQLDDRSRSNCCNSLFLMLYVRFDDESLSGEGDDVIR